MVTDTDREMIAEAVHYINPEFEVTDDLQDEDLRTVISQYSSKARTACLGQNSDFCRGVLIALQLHQEGKLP